MDTFYREIILDHYTSPRHRGEIEGATGFGRAYNPVCGDDVRVQVRIDEGRLVVGFTGNGCAMSQASASVMSDGVTGRTVAEAHELVASIKQMIHGGPPPEGPGLDDLVAFVGVRQFPARVKCCLLAWDALQESLVGTA